MTTSTVFLPPIRPTVRAVVFRSGKLLVQVKQRAGGSVYLTLPGGAQELGESMPESVARECFEEVGAEVTVGPLLHMADVFKQKETGLRHQVEALFVCDVPEAYEPCVGPKPDRSQIDTIWADLETQADLFQPGYALHLLDPKAPFYLGCLHA